MAVHLIDPPGLPEIPIYKQVSVATGSKLVHVAGQVAWGGGDLATQVEESYLNVGTALAGVGATFADVVKLTMHVRDHLLAMSEKISRASESARARSASGGNAPTSCLFPIRPTLVHH
ncbi:RidA family protein [Micromonospora sp. NPDC003816]|uniref:RidA family protein n=1 Tax=Micromonospora sp. NPDC003816 TaxID=3364224 RepID=UPI003685F332